MSVDTLGRTISPRPKATALGRSNPTGAEPWRELAACRDADDTLFFHPEGERGSTRQRRTNAAKAICQECPAMLACRDLARARRETHGTWGGESEDERDDYLGRDRNGKASAARKAEREAAA